MRTELFQNYIRSLRKVSLLLLVCGFRWITLAPGAFVRRLAGAGSLGRAGSVFASFQFLQSRTIKRSSALILRLDLRHQAL